MNTTKYARELPVSWSHGMTGLNSSIRKVAASIVRGAEALFQLQEEWQAQERTLTLEQRLQRTGRVRYR